MIKRAISQIQQFSVTRLVFKWILLVIPVALVTGSMVALFLWMLEAATLTRFRHAWLLWLLPIAGFIIYMVYAWFCKACEAGNNLVIDEIHTPGKGVPLRMAPMVLLTTVATHLFGGSAGREGTAVQIGGSIAAYFAKKIGLQEEDTRLLLMAGIAAGFGAVFGTPVTGAIFALEVIAAGRMQYNALLPCFAASVLADITCTAWGIHHTAYHISFQAPAKIFLSFFHANVLLLLKVALAGIAFGLASYLFTVTVHAIKKYSRQWLRLPWLVPIAGGLVIIAFAGLLGTSDYLGIGVTNPDPTAVSIVSCFKYGGATNFSWIWKLLFTAITLGTGFKGGEVTPLFFIGAALGNFIAVQFGLPVDLLAGLGFIAVFAGATNTPIACTFMGVELFGGGPILYYAVACIIAFYFSGKSGIYPAQRWSISKSTSQPLIDEEMKDL